MIDEIYLNVILDRLINDVEMILFCIYDDKIKSIKKDFNDKNYYFVFGEKDTYHIEKHDILNLIKVKK